ncbi:ABC-2 type transport system ATP-binding protein/lipopolysaccharide transport system ATP-binding protein [Advenella incenata]|uniref:ABC-2 type transport system ATP-binding protein/lipopolysaccharide transport system ATP-binding protein n=1 Tax=Advenella incenata TaxID=267800 RepID=A0A4Q7VRH1_9BURK|nr:ABC transporter ATP-binding protein [Advenella incenata]RZT99111.1 ABC-2 type transport system ATP-binding protein/lipopolysaccharide transport system ATP-binding protein [Advenella incenata]
MTAYIKAENLNVEMPVYDLSGRSMKLRVLGSLKNDRLRSDHGITVVKALQDLHFEFGNGDRVGLVGRNGAGKSTLLRVLAGIYEPTNGTLITKGRAVALLDMGLGMDETLSGYDNIRLRGTLLGMSTAEIKEKTEEIADFTDLNDYLYLPIRTYSSGMRIRLAFAISTALDPEILLLDEVIGVGDAAFLDKANKRLKEFQQRAKIVFVASHSNQVIRDMCNKAIWLDGGKQMMVGPVEEVISAYEQSF